MRYFFSYIIDEDQLVLDGEEAKHCTKVMRKKTGDQIHVLDGRGHRYTAVISDLRRNSCIADIIKKEHIPTQRDWKLTIAMSPLKNPSRLEWFIEKAAEMGIDRIVPIQCKRTEKPTIKRTRILNILISAMKQSGQYRLPILDELTPFDDYIKSINGQLNQKFIPYCGQELPHFSKLVRPALDTIILIGPEGDFTEEEFSFATINDFQGISLGVNRLRTETAGIYACAGVHTLNNIIS